MSPVVDTGEDGTAGGDVGFVLLALLDRRLLAIKVLHAAEALDPLANQVAIRHGVPHQGGPQAELLDELGDPARGLALAGSGACCAHGDHRAPAADHGAVRTEQGEIGSCSEDPGRDMHHRLVADIAVGEDHRVRLEPGDQLLEIRLGVDRDSLRVSIPRQLRGVAAPGDSGNLGRREGDDFDRRVVSIGDVEVVEVPSGGSHDDHAVRHERRPPYGLRSSP